MYDNIIILAPDGEVLSRVGAKKAQWYLKRSLATKIDEKTIQLTFEPKGRGSTTEFELSERKSICVVCGVDKDLTKHHVVPYSYRRFMPEEYKDKHSFDVLPVCEPCHVSYNKVAFKFDDEFYDEFEISKACPYSSTIRYLNLLERHRHSIPKEKVKEITLTIEVALGKKISPSEFKEELEALKEKRSKHSYRKILLEEFTLEEFVIIWRKHFIETANPKFLPNAWQKDMLKVKGIK